MQEVEIKFLDVDPVEMEKRLIKVGAQKEWSRLLEEWIYGKEEWSKISARVRVRNDGFKITVSYKETTQNTGQGNPEIEFEASRLAEVFVFLEKMGLKKYRHQQKKRTHFVLGDLSVDIDLWPKMPPLLEIEGPIRESLVDLAAKLDLDINKAVELDTFQIYKQIYHIDIDSDEELVF